MTDKKQKDWMSRRDLVFSGSLGLGALTLGGAAGAGDAIRQVPVRWDLEADVVVIGTGALGLPAAIFAKEAGSSVIMVEAEKHAGGHAIVSGGTIPLGGGTSAQRKYGIVDSPDLLFRDLTDWSVVEPNGFPDFRYNDREVVRAFADNAARTYEWLVGHGVQFMDIAPGSFDGTSCGNSAPRSNYAAGLDWPMPQTGKPSEAQYRKVIATGAGVICPLLVAAEKVGVKILLQHRMTSIVRENPQSGRVLGIVVNNNGKALNIRARKAVVVGTGGSTGNVNFRRMFDPRLTEEYCGLAGMPWSNQDASGEIAAMAIGASLWGLYNQTGEFGSVLSKPGFVGCQYGYMPVTMQMLSWMPGSQVFDKARAIGLRVADWQDLILVNMLGSRFYDETQGGFTANDFQSVKPYTQGSYLNAKNIKYNPNNYLNAALAGINDGHNGGGPIWAIFDAHAVARESWDPTPPYVDFAAGFFFTANTLAELAGAIKMKYQRSPMPAATLEASVARYNSFVESGVDADFGKSKPLYKIEKPPFYAAWATPNVHDTRAGLRINAKCEVMDMNGAVIPGLYCGGESAGGFSQHGLARATCQGYIIGTSCVALRPEEQRL
jgi:succinate dehydrogenase/fumarate reductase flavoprotein subunit